MYDAIVIGGRCAGAATAMELGRAGRRVLVVERARFGSDMAMSTHLLWPPAIAALRRWGLLDAVRAVAPPISTYRFDFGQFALEGEMYPVDGIADSYSPRRSTLDKLLVDAAAAAGVELREEVRFVEVLREDDRVVGFRGRDRAGREFEERARIVIGADGPQSAVARSVGAEEYEQRPVAQVTAWSYWSGVPIAGFEGYPRPWRMVYAWSTETDLALVGVNWPIAQYHALSSDIETEFFAVVDAAAPDLAARLRAGRREERWSRGSCPNFLRRAHGPGWALVGDAGYCRDPCTAQGISDAFRDATGLAAAIDVGLSGRGRMEDVLADYQRRRDGFVRPFLDFATEVATFAPPTPDQIQFYAALQGNAEQTARLFGTFGQTVSPVEFLAPDNIAAVFTAAS